MLLSEKQVKNAWSSVKNFMGNAWHHGQKTLGTIDRYANLGMRILGAGAQSGLIKGRALEMGLDAARGYDDLKGRAERVGRDVDRTVGRFRAAAPELNI